VQLESTQVNVTIGEARVSPGDLVRGDADGVIVVPSSREEEVLSVAEAIEAAEMQIRAALDSGVRLDVARAQQHYHTLQSKG
jgi:regulator of RNase E activity RraA